MSFEAQLNGGVLYEAFFKIILKTTKWEAQNNKKRPIFTPFWPYLATVKNSSANSDPIWMTNGKSNALFYAHVHIEEIFEITWKVPKWCMKMYDVTQRFGIKPCNIDRLYIKQTSHLLLNINKFGVSAIEWRSTLWRDFFNYTKNN